MLINPYNIDIPCPGDIPFMTVKAIGTKVKNAITKAHILRPVYFPSR